MTLELATEGCCQGHKCDNCATCRKGRCCRRDNPNYRLPELGEWDGPIYGELGVLNDDGDKVECHACGKWFVRLHNHALNSHDLTEREYKAIFGLNMGTGLVGPRLAQSLLESGRRLRASHSMTIADHWTPEQSSAVASRSRSLQMRKHGSEAHRSISVGQGVHKGSTLIHKQSRFVGVYRERQQWRTSIKRLGQSIYIGIFPTEEEAAHAYDAKARELYGDAARLNFP